MEGKDDGFCVWRLDSRLSPEWVAEHDQVPGHRNKNEIETLQEVGPRHILHEGLMCRQIWEQVTNKLTRTQDSIIGLQSNKSKLLKQVDSSCRVWAAESAEVAEDENCVEKLQGKSSNSVNNQEPQIQTS